MSFSRVVTVVAGLAAAGAAGGGVASWWHLNAGPQEDMTSEGFSGDEIASIEGIVGTYLQANPVTPPKVEAPAAQGLAESDTPKIEDIVRNYLLTKPEVMRDVFAALEAKEDLERNAQVKDMITQNADQLYGGTKGLVLGNPEGDVTLVEFFDYNCGFCKRAFSDLSALIQSDKNLKVVMKEFPILSPASSEAAKVSLAAAKQGRYMDFHARLLSAPGQANGAKALRLAEELGLDMAQVKSDMQSTAVSTELDQTQQMAAAMGIRGTPAYVIGNELIPGAVGLEALQAKIKSIRDEACTTC